MASFVKFHMPENVFRGSPPDKEGEYLSRYYIVVGGSLEALADNKRKVEGGKAKGSGESSVKGGVTDLSKISVVLKAFGAHYRLGENQTWEPELDRQDLDGEDTVGTIRPKATRLQKRSIPFRLFNTWELLFPLWQKLDQELPELYFDHLRFHRTCWKLLRKLKAEIMSLLHVCFEEGILEDERAMWQLPEYILMTADGSGKLRKKIAMRDIKKGVPLSMDVLKAAGKVIEEFLEGAK